MSSVTSSERRVVWTCGLKVNGAAVFALSEVAAVVDSVVVSVVVSVTVPVVVPSGSVVADVSGASDVFSIEVVMLVLSTRSLVVLLAVFSFLLQPDNSIAAASNVQMVFFTFQSPKFSIDSQGLYHRQRSMILSV